MNCAFLDFHYGGVTFLRRRTPRGPCWVMYEHFCERGCPYREGFLLGHELLVVIDGLRCRSWIRRLGGGDLLSSLGRNDLLSR